ncbi:MAG: DinB family protein, partial [Pyrinomonadaceae bacterium]
MSNKTADVIAEIEKITEDFRSAFGSLTDSQLNWKPTGESWSVAQCLDHLIKSNDEVRPAIDAKLSGAKNSFWESWSPLTGFFGGFLKKSLMSDKRKFKAPTKNIVPPSDIPPQIVERFAENQTVVIESIRAMDGLDWD